MKKVLLFCFLTLIVLSACYSSTHSITLTATPTLAETLFVLSTQTPQVLNINSPTQELDWFIYYLYVPEENFWHEGQYRYTISSDCSSASYLPSVEGRQVGFRVDENQALFQDGVVELTYSNVWLLLDGMDHLGSFNPKQQTEFIFGYDRLSFEQASEAVSKCKVQVTINDNLTLLLSPMEPTQEWNFGTYYAKP